MMLILLPLAGLLLGGEALETLQNHSSWRPRFYIAPVPQYYHRVRAAQQAMKTGVQRTWPLGIWGHRATFVNLRPTRLPLSRGPTIEPPKTHSKDSDHLSFGQDDKPFDKENKPSSSEKDGKDSSFGEDHKPFDKENKPSSSEKDRKDSSFGEDHKPFDKENKALLLDKRGSHPDRNLVCNILPDSGTCRAALPRYYFDPETGTCNCFLFGGCREDGKKESPGSFFTLDECQRECRPPKLEEGPTCKNIFKEDQFISYLVHPPSQSRQTDHLKDKEFLSLFYK